MFGETTDVRWENQVELVSGQNAESSRVSAHAVITVLNINERSNMPCYTDPRHGCAKGVSNWHGAHKDVKETTELYCARKVGLQDTD